MTHARTTFEDERATTYESHDPCSATVAGSHPLVCIRPRGHGGRHRGIVRCERCETRPVRRPRAWRNALVTGPGLCAQCAKELGGLRAWRR